MTARLLNVRRLLRVQGTQEEVLELKPGVNVLVGGPNAGKTKWLRTLDYLLGDTGGVEDALGEELAAKYDRAAVELMVDGKPLLVERRWKERGARHKLFVDGRPIPSAEFSAFFLEALGIPQVRIPKGNPYAQHAWPELSWRMLLRHVYRAEGAWSDLAPKQPDSEQFAVLMQFLGCATAVFSPMHARLVELHKQEAKLEAQKASYEEVLADVARELVAGEGLTDGLSRESLAAAISQVQAELATHDAQREARLAELRRSAEAEAARTGAAEGVDFEGLGRTLDEARARRTALVDAIAAGERRVAELSRQDWHHVVHCPACERVVEREALPPGTCVLCLQPHAPTAESAAVDETVALAAPPEPVPGDGTPGEGASGADAEQVRAEVEQARGQLRAVEEDIAQLEERLRPVRAAAAWLLPPDFSVLEQETGRLQERLRQLTRIEAALGRRDSLVAQLDALRAERTGLEAKAARARSEPDFTTLGDQLADAMRGYLNALDARDRERWAARSVSVSVSRSAAQLLVDRKPWGRKLGANLRAYFFLAYHYAWLRLSRTEPFTYPGLVVLDFPANLGDFGVSNQERYLLVPFVGLLSRPDMKGVQLIAAGRAFAQLPGAHRVDLTSRWR